MSCSSNLFSCYSPYSGHDKIHITYYTFSCISGKGVIYATLSLPRQSVLFISRRTHNLNYSVTSYPFYCVFQDLTIQRMIGIGSGTGKWHVFQDLACLPLIRLSFWKFLLCPFLIVFRMLSQFPNDNRLWMKKWVLFIKVALRNWQSYLWAREQWGASGCIQ